MRRYGGLFRPLGRIHPEPQFSADYAVGVPSDLISRQGQHSSDTNSSADYTISTFGFDFRQGQVRLVCLSYFDADLSTAGARFAVRRLRRRLGD